MRNRLCVIILSILSCTGTSRSQGLQPRDSKDVGLAIGVVEYQVRDRVLNNLRHRGTLVSGSFFRIRTRTFSQTRFDFDLTFSKLASRFDPDRSTFASSLAFSYSYARSVPLASHAYRVYLGGVAGLESHLTFYENWDDSHFYWLTSYFIGLRGSLTISISDTRSVFVNIAAPMLALVSRPESRILYKTVSRDAGWILSKLHDGMRLTTVHEHQAVDVTVGFLVGHRFRRGLLWRFHFVHNSIPSSRSLSILSHRLGALIVF